MPRSYKFRQRKRWNIVKECQKNIELELFGNYLETNTDLDDIKFQKYLDPTDFENLTLNYDKIVKLLKQKMEELLSENISFMIRTLEIKITILIDIFQNLVQVKNSLIVTSGLNPPLFEILFEQLHLINVELIEKSPMVHLAVLISAKKFVEIHEYFYPQSDLTLNAKTNNDFSFVSESKSSKYFEIIIKSLIVLIKEGNRFQKDALLELLGFIQGMSDVVNDCDVDIIYEFKQELIFLVFVVIDKPYLVRRLFESIARKFSLTESFPIEVNHNAKRFWKKFFSFCENLTENLLRNLYYIYPSSCFVRVLMNHYQYGLFVKHQTLSLEHKIQQKEFASLMSFILKQNKKPLMYTEDNIHKTFEVYLYDEKISETEKWRYLMNRLALFCIENKMKTIYGKPLETFTTLENSLNNILNDKNVEKQLQYVLFGNYRINDENDDDNDEIKQKIMTSSEEMLRVNNLLSFIDMLEKFMIYSERGSILEIYKPTDSVKQFFYTNSSSCQAWIARVTVLIQKLSIKSGRYAQAIRFGNLYCMNVKQRFDKVKQGNYYKFDDNSIMILGYLTQALMELNSSSAISGIRVFAKNVFNIDLEFTCPAEYIASGKLELAFEQINKLLLSEGLNQFVQELLINFRLLIVRKLRNPVMLNQLISENNYDENITGEIKRLKTLINWDKPDELLSGNHISLPWEIEKRLEDFEIKFMDIYSKMNIHSKNIRNKWDPASKKPYEDQLKKLSFELNRYAFMINNVDISPKIRTKFAVLDAIKRCVSMKLWDFGYKNGTNKKDIDSWLDYENVLLDDWKLDTTDRLSYAIQLNNWITQIGHPTSEILTKSHELLIKLARKTENCNTARYYYRRLEKSFDDKLMKSKNYQQKNGILPSSIGNRTLSSPTAPTNYGFPLPQSTPYNIPIVQHGMVNYVPPGIPIQTPQIQSANEYLSLDAAIHATKIARLSKNRPSDHLAFFTLAKITAVQDVMCSSAISPGLIRNDEEFVKKILTIKQICLKLGNWSKDVDDAHKKICDENRYQPLILWDMVIKRFNLLSGYCGDVNKEKTLTGAFYWLSTEIGNNLTGCDVYYSKAHRKMSEWALDQLYEPDETLIKLTTFELKKLEEFGIKTDNAAFKNVRKLLTTCEDVFEFKKEIVDVLSAEELNICKINESPFVSLFEQIKQRQKGLYDVALCGCMQYLAHLGRHNPESTIHSVAATLHILQLLVSRPDLFEKSTKNGLLNQINENVWKDIIPQLFARLNHPNDVVRNVICNLLKLIGQSSPHAVCYPAVVGAYYSKPILLTNSNNVDGDDDSLEMTSNNNKHDRTLMSISCLSIVESIKKNYPKLIDDVTKFIDELQRINMLFEEKWAFVLNNLDVEVSKRLRSLKTDLTDEERAEKMKKINVFTGIVRRILQDLYDLTCEKTNDLSTNEKQFQNHFKEELLNAFEHYDEYRISDPKFAWESFRKLGAILNNRASKRFSIQLLTSEMSPYLSSMDDTAIPIPDQELNEGKIVTIAKMKEHVTVLLTKTRPKKITFVGSDGKDYVFLLKGQEDLHLDERVMQLLHICNLMLSDKKTIEPNDAWPPYHSQNYSVTPIGIRSGLIRWVEGATPMFQIYRKWKNRQSLIEKKNNPNNENDNNTIGAERPMDLFAKQLQSVFIENNVPNDVRCDRKKWPVLLLKQVLERLTEATSRDILAKELWMTAGNSETWWRVTQRFARSAAVASMVGFIIGLGDRHMENLLINLSTGDIIHIDYNVCFDKGRHLRVPETVPFRLTGNIIYALGPTQIEGTYRKSCEHVISVLRNGKETLLAMLDAFVYDPLVDWAMQDQLSTSVNIGTMLAVYGHKITLDNEEGLIKTKKIQEEENMHAKLISKRIRRRLEGKEHLENLDENSTLTDIVKKYNKNSIDAPLCIEGPELTPIEQVDMLINCATNINNLAFMYEGWTAWV